MEPVTVTPTHPRPHTHHRALARGALILFYGLAGIGHLVWPDMLLTVMPSWVPAPLAVIALTGVAELAGAAGLLIPRLRKAAGVGLALYAVCVFPANIEHAADYLADHGWGPGWWYHGPRLVLQPVIVWWALWASELTEWPFPRRPAPDRRTPAE